VSVGRVTYTVDYVYVNTKMKTPGHSVMHKSDYCTVLYYWYIFMSRAWNLDS